MPASERQRANLALGAPAKRARAQLKREIEAGRVNLARLVAGLGDERHERTAMGMVLLELLSADPDVRTRIVSVAVAARVEVNVRVRDLTTRERMALAGAINEEAIG